MFNRDIDADVLLYQGSSFLQWLHLMQIPTSQKVEITDCGRFGPKLDICNNTTSKARANTAEERVESM